MPVEISQALDERAQMTFPENFWVGIVGSGVFGLVGLFLLLLGYKSFDWLTPKLDVLEQLNKGNMAVAMVITALLFSIAFITAHVVR